MRPTRVILLELLLKDGECAHEKGGKRKGVERMSPDAMSTVLKKKKKKKQFCGPLYRKDFAGRQHRGERKERKEGG